VRVLAATNRPEAIPEDALHRFGHILRVPPLRARRADIPRLADEFFALARKQAERESLRFPRKEAKKLADESFDWPGNIRQLRGAITRAVHLHKGTRDLTADEVLKEANTVQWGLAISRGRKCPRMPRNRGFAFCVSRPRVSLDTQLRDNALERSPTYAQSKRSLRVRHRWPRSERQRAERPAAARPPPPSLRCGPGAASPPNARPRPSCVCWRGRTLRPSAGPWASPPLPSANGGTPSWPAAAPP
jgi:DNA-binding NtrC family response regulator